MKTKQLANVLIKILGLSVCVHSVPGVISGLFSVARAKGGHVPGEYWFYPLPSLVSLAIGVYLIAMSWKVAAFLFKGEEDA